MVHRQEFTKSDGRLLYLYGGERNTAAPLPEENVASVGRAHLCWHPLRSEWMIHAAHRKNRGNGAPSDHCPLCPGRPDRVGEIPFEEFEAAVFENRFAALHRDAPEPPSSPVPTARAAGRCEVVVYTSEHDGHLASLPDSRIELLLHVWIDRYRVLYSEPDIRFVYPFENRGKECGMSVEHPHGQIFGLPYVPGIIQSEVAAFQRGPVLADLLRRLSADYIIEQDEHTVAFVPPCANFAYEVWIVPRRPQPGPWEFSSAELASFGRVLGAVTRRYDRLGNGSVFPYTMLLHAAPKGAEDRFHFHVEFCPPLGRVGKGSRVVSVNHGLMGVESCLVSAAGELRRGGSAVEPSGTNGRPPGSRKVTLK